MGNQPGSRLVRDGEAYAWIQDPSAPGFGMSQPVELSTQPPPTSLPRRFQESNTSEYMLWNSLAGRINPLTRNLNKGMKCAFYFMLIAIVAFGFAPIIVNSLLPKMEIFRYLRYAQMSVFVFVFLFFFLYGNILKRNASIDDEIRKIVTQEFSSRAKELNYRLEYRTMYTGFCKPKGVKPARLLAFVPIVLTEQETYGNTYDNKMEEGAATTSGFNNNSTTTQAQSNDEFKDDDLIDRKAWGLE